MKTFKKLIVLGLTATMVLSFAGGASAKSSRSSSHGPGTGSKSSSSSVHSYTTKSGTHVNSHHRTTPDHTVRNNYSTKPNYNPWTGSTGTRTYSR